MATLPSLPVNATTLVNTTADVANTGLDAVRSVAEGVTGLVPAGFTFGFENFIELLIIHVVFIFIFHKAGGLFKGIILSAIISGMFPVILNVVFKAPIPLNAETIFTFVIFGMVVFVMLKLFWKIARRKSGGE